MSNEQTLDNSELQARIEDRIKDIILLNQKILEQKKYKDLTIRPIIEAGLVGAVIGGVIGFVLGGPITALVGATAGFAAGGFIMTAVYSLHKYISNKKHNRKINAYLTEIDEIGDKIEEYRNQIKDLKAKKNESKRLGIIEENASNNIHTAGSSKDKENTQMSSTNSSNTNTFFGNYEGKENLTNSSPENTKERTFR